MVPRLGLEGLPRAYRAGVGLAGAVLLTAQVLGQSTLTFPAVEWGMYSRPVPPQPVFFAYALHTADGGEVAFDVTRAFPSLSRRVMYLLARTARRMARTPAGPARDALAARYDATLAAVGRAAGRRLGVRPDGVVVRRCTLALDGRRAVIGCEPFHETRLPAPEASRAA